MSEISNIGVLTSGGDAPGMNAATRATVRTAIANGLRVTGIIRGYTGLVAGDFEQLQARSVSNIVQLGGTMLKTSRCEAFLEPEGREQAAARMADAGIDGLIAIGGDGTFRGLRDIYVEHGVSAIGVPGTIDNDIYGTDLTIGFDTAVNTALESIDKIRDTADSHDRIFFIEVMGRKCGAIALEVGVSGGAEAVLVPEVPVDLDELSRAIAQGKSQGKTSYIVVVGRGAGAVSSAGAAPSDSARESQGSDESFSAMVSFDDGVPNRGRRNQAAARDLPGEYTTGTAEGEPGPSATALPGGRRASSRPSGTGRAGGSGHERLDRPDHAAVVGHVEERPVRTG